MPTLLMLTSTHGDAACSEAVVDAETGSTISVLTVKQCLHQYGVQGHFLA